MAHSTAFLTSASPNTMSADLPPSSMEAGRRFLAAAKATFRPVTVLPVKATLATPGCSLHTTTECECASHATSPANSHAQAICQSQNMVQVPPTWTFFQNAPGLTGRHLHMAACKILLRLLHQRLMKLKHLNRGNARTILLLWSKAPSFQLKASSVLELSMLCFALLKLSS